MLDIHEIKRLPDIGVVKVVISGVLELVRMRSKTRLAFLSIDPTNPYEV